jgi:hypothetical protein
MKKAYAVVVLLLLPGMALGACVPATPAPPPAAEEPAAEEPAAEEPPAEETAVEEETAAIDPLETGPVVILVIDDFGLKDVPVQLEELQGLQDGHNCVVTPDGQRASSEGAGSGPDGQPHGELVYLVLRDEIEAQSVGLLADLSDQPADQPRLGGLKYAEHWDMGDGDEILLLGLDTIGFTTDIVTQRITETIKFFDQSRWGLQPARRYVLNMSFAVIVCKWLDPSYPVDELIELYRAEIASDTQFEDQLGELEQLLDEIAGMGDEQRQRDALFGDALGRVGLSLDYPTRDIADEGDPLGILLREFEEEARGGTPDKRVISIAAAGNNGYPLPFFPARWDSVLSVSASDATDYQSNFGEVAMEGDYDDEVKGTSYAAPRLSFQAARYLLDGGTAVCTGTLQLPTTPPLAYADRILGPWDNLPLSDAAHDYCTEFPH